VKVTATDDESDSVRIPLNRDRVLGAAVSIADSDGIDAVTMRRVGQELGVEAMSLYNHVANKDDLLDGMVETIVDEVIEMVATQDPPETPDDWKRAARDRILSAREVMLAHPWAPAVIETRTDMTPELVRYFDGLLGILLAGGMTFDLGHHAMHALGSRALGFSQRLFVPDDAHESSGSEVREMEIEFPNLAGMLTAVSHDGGEPVLGWCDDQTEFTFGLDLILDGLDLLRAAATR